MKLATYEIQVPFVTTSADTAKDIVRFADLKAGQRAVDLGSGDGRVVLELAKAGLIVDGFEHKPELVRRSRQRIRDANLQDHAQIFATSFWDVDLSSYDVIYIYGMNSVLGRVEKKLEKEMRPDAKFISNVFKLPHWRPKKSEKYLHLYGKQMVNG